MKQRSKYLLFVALFILGACGVKYQSVGFTKKRTPLNPIAHGGIVNYSTRVVLEYEEQARMLTQQYENTVTSNRQQYQQALQRYNNATPSERILQGLSQPRLVLPEKPIVPYLHNTAILAQKINIEGMNKVDQNALNITVYYQGFDVNSLTVKKQTKKRKKDEVEYVDTVYVGSSNVKNPVRIEAKAPQGETYNAVVQQTNRYTKVQTSSFSDSLVALSQLKGKINEVEIALPERQISYINELLNSQFGTKDVQYTVKLFKYESNKHDYSDLNNALIQAQMGFSQLNTKPNEAYEKLAEAYSIWNAALGEYRPDKKARINDKVKQGVLLNLFALAIFTDNWEGSLNYMTQLDNMKLKSAYAAEFNRLKQLYSDLKKRFDVMNK
jgi:hypothetical protein